MSVPTFNVRVQRLACLRASFGLGARQRRPLRRPAAERVKTICSFAASLINAVDHGGSNVSSTLQLVTPGIDLIFSSTVPGREAASGQLGEVRVIFT